MFNIYEIQDDDGTTSYVQVWTGALSHADADDDSDDSMDGGDCTALYHKEHAALQKRHRDMQVKEIMRLRDAHTSQKHH